jgi:hypothetical protein
MADINSWISEVELVACGTSPKLDVDDIAESEPEDEISYSARSVSESIMGPAVLLLRLPVVMSVASDSL